MSNRTQCAEETFNMSTMSLMITAAGSQVQGYSIQERLPKEERVSHKLLLRSAKLPGTAILFCMQFFL